jgi:zinc protease
MPTILRFAFIALGLSLAVCRTALSSPVTAAELPEIRYERHVLANGLRLIIHEDHKAPVVAVNG